MRYFKLAILSLMLGCILALSPATPDVSAKNYCWDCYSQVGSSHFCYNFSACSTIYGECIYDTENGTTDCPMPYLVTCCF